MYSWGDKHKGDWEGMSERAGIHGGPSYIDFCPRHPRRASATPASHPTQSSQEAAPSGAGVGVGHRRDSVREIGTEGKEQNAMQNREQRTECGREITRETRRDREKTLLAALSTGEALGGGTLSHSTPDHRRQSATPLRLSLRSLPIQITGTVAFEGRGER